VTDFAIHSVLAQEVFIMYENGSQDELKIAADLLKKYTQPVKSKPRLERYIESIFINHAEVIFDARARHIKLMRVDQVMALVNRYYKFTSTHPQAQGRLRKTVRRVRDRVDKRLRRMETSRLQLFMALVYREQEKKRKRRKNRSSRASQASR
jgi:hypothetical protein